MQQENQFIKPTAQEEVANINIQPVDYGALRQDVGVQQYQPQEFKPIDYGSIAQAKQRREQRFEPMGNQMTGMTTDQPIVPDQQYPVGVGGIQKQIKSVPGQAQFSKMPQQGYAFKKTKADNLRGECAWFAQQHTRMPDGKRWTVGDTIGQKVNSLKRFRQKGQGFLRGESSPQVGNSIIFNTGNKWGHVATIRGVRPDGKLLLTESNYNNDLRVRHDRVVDPNDPKIVGYLRTKAI